MTKEFIPYEQALQLKELGFNKACFGYYVDGELRGINLGMEELGGKEPYYQRFGFHTLSNHDIDNPNKTVVTAPLYQQAFRWFEVSQSIFIERIITTNANEIMNIEYNIKSWRFPTITIEFDNSYDVFNKDKADLECLKKLIEITKNK